MKKNKKGKVINAFNANLNFRPKCCYCKKDCGRMDCFSEAVMFTRTDEFKEFVNAAAKVKADLFVVRKKKYDIDVYFTEDIRIE